MKISLQNNTYLSVLIQGLKGPSIQDFMNTQRPEKIKEHGENILAVSLMEAIDSPKDVNF